MNIKILKTNENDLTLLEEIYDLSFESNPSPPTKIILTEEEKNDTDLSRKISFNDSKKITLSIFYDEKLIGGVIISPSEDNLNILERLFIHPNYQRKGIGFQVWNHIENNYSNEKGWILRSPTYLINNACFYINKCGFTISKVEDVGDDGIGMFVYTKKINNDSSKE